MEVGGGAAQVLLGNQEVEQCSGSTCFLHHTLEATGRMRQVMSAGELVRRGKLCLIVWPDPTEERASVGKVKFFQNEKDLH